MGFYLLDGVDFFVVKYVNKLTKVCIVRAAREEYQKVWCSITLVKSIANHPAVFNLLDLSGKYFVLEFLFLFTEC